MEFSYLIVTHGRVVDLSQTLKVIYPTLDVNKDEVLVYIDACESTEQIRDQFPWVRWFSGHKRISASPARAFLYPQAKGKYLIGLDDDAHIITSDYKEKIRALFAQPKIGVLAFKEVKGIFYNDDEALSKVENTSKFYETNDFIGCGFAIRKDVYDATRGFPTWIDIYGEEPCLSLEVMDIGFELWFTNQIAVNHRVDLVKRKLQGKNYFRFQKQLQNSFFIFLNYYPKPLLPIVKLLFHNLKKYGLKDITYMKLYIQALKHIFVNYRQKKQFRKPVTDAVLQKIRTSKPLSY